MLRAEHVDAFLSSAFTVLGTQVQARPERGAPVLRSGPSAASRELTGLVVIEGELTGVVFYSMSLATAVKLHALAHLDSAPDLAPLADDVVLQAARTIAAGGIEHLRAQGCQCTTGEAVLVYGFGEPLTEVSPVLFVPLYTQFGDMDIGIALRPPASLSAGVRLISARADALRMPADRGDEQRRGAEHRTEATAA